MAKDIAVIGLGIFGREVALSLERRGISVLAVDVNRKVIEEVKDRVTGAVVASVTDEDALAELHIRRFDAVILGLGGNFEQMVLGVTLLQRQGAQRIIARANTEIQQEILLKIGAHEVILPEKQTAEALAARLFAPNVMDQFFLDEEASLAEVRVNGAMEGKTLRELDLRKKFGITALILKREGHPTRIITEPETELKENDLLVVVGDDEQIEKAFR